MARKFFVGEDKKMFKNNYLYNFRSEGLAKTLSQSNKQLAGWLQTTGEVPP
ncbi:hypothetical protein [Burkholderia pseudomallei]|uniref:hypothetical protein n=1 Tax=Burkholderia pseudomallei TaxID=28450 RepID=UPI0016034F1E|nr:hypothetical protein [Burkholderia pseudomallei]